MKAYLIRHGDKETGEHRTEGLGLNDQPISRDGRRQARRLCRHFRAIPVSAIYISEYLRTLQTIQPLSRRLRLAPVRDPRLNEIDIGAAEGLTDQQIMERHPDAWSAYRAGDRDFRWPDGESGTEAQARITDFLEEKRGLGGTIVVAAHEGILRILVCTVLGLPVYSRFLLRIDTAGITEVEWDAGRSRWRLIRVNQSV